MTNTKDQKVFVKLADVLELQKFYKQALERKTRVGAATNSTDWLKSAAQAQVSTIERVIKTLQLPIDI